MTVGDRIEAVYAIAKEMGKSFTKADAKAFVEAEDKKIEEALLNGESIKTSYGTVKVTHRKERKGRNPKTQEEVMIPAKDTLKISVNAAFENKLNKKNN
jgi:nucleoid DNA-binding protein